MNRSLYLLLSFLFIFTVNSLLYAQDLGSNSAGASVARSKETLKYYNRELEHSETKKRITEEEEVVDETIKEPSVKPSTITQKILIKKIIVTESVIISNDAIANITKRYENKNLSMMELTAAVDDINELYKEKKNITSKAFLPPQKIKDGIVKINLIEGRLGNLMLEGNESTRDSYFYKRLELNSGDIVDLSKLENELFLFNRKNDVSLRAVLRPGTELATTDYILKVNEPNKFDVLLYFDNAGRDETGLERYGLVANHNSLFGIRDKLSLGGLLADGTKNGFASYNLPINKYGTRLGLSYDASRTALRSGVLKNFKITGHSYAMGVSLSHPLYIGKRSEINAFSAFSSKRSATFYDNFTTLAEKLKTVSYGFDYASFLKTTSWEFRNFITNGLNRPNGDAKFFKYNAELNNFWRLSDKTFSLFRSKLQYTDTDTLPSSEQFQIGGVATVRGYPEGMITGENGYLLSAELSFSISSKDNVRFILFADHGGTLNTKSSSITTVSDDSISSLGFGFNVNFTKNLSGRIMCGVPMVDYGAEEAHQPVIHFDMQLRF